MVTMGSIKPADLCLEDGFVYALAVVSSASGAGLATYKLLFDFQLPLAVFLFTQGLILSAVILGYGDSSFLAAILIGTLPWAGYWASVWAWPPFDANRIEGLGAGAFLGTMWALPLASLLFIVGVALRRDGTFTERKRSLILLLAIAVLVSVAIALALDMRLLRVHGDQ